MTLIGFDTSLATTSAGLLRDDGELFSTPAPDPVRLFEPARHSEELLAELARLLSESGTTWADVDSVAVGVGPGTFTGLRIGVATARALAQALGVTLRPVSSLEAIATGLAVQQDVATKPRPLLGLIDARRRQVFTALYRRSAEAGIRSGRSLPLEHLWKPAALDPTKLLGRIEALDAPPICAGDWAIRFRAQLEGVGAVVPPSESGVHSVSGLHLCRLATLVRPVPPEAVYPVYLRLPDAEITRRRLLGKLDDDRG